MSGLDDGFLPVVSPLGTYGSSGLVSPGEENLDPSFTEDRTDPEDGDYDQRAKVEIVDENGQVVEDELSPPRADPDRGDS